jgi:hypothetical protein
VARKQVRLCKRSKLGWDGLRFHSSSIGITFGREHHTSAFIHGVRVGSVQDLAGRMMPSGLRLARLNQFGLPSKGPWRFRGARS